MTEHEIQAQIVAYLRLKNILVFNLDVMSGLQFFSHKDHRRFAFINHHKKIGYEKGQPDIIIVLQDNLVAVEVKTETGRLSKEQKDIENKLTSLNNTYLVWRSLDDAIEWCKSSY
ncbi:MAG: hypothetical protein GY861_14050 [bacterium]|nr:hypothetical protein [bacterium]